MTITPGYETRAIRDTRYDRDSRTSRDVLDSGRFHEGHPWNDACAQQGLDYAGCASLAVHAAPQRVRGAADKLRRPASARGPRSRRPAGAAVRHQGAGVLLSRASHRPRPITPATTVLLALVAGAITLWLGLMAQAGGVVGGAVETPSRLAVVQVQAGESLQQVAHRVAPDVPVSDVVERIRELNELESVALDAGQTLIAPLG